VCSRESPRAREILVPKTGPIAPPRSGSASRQQVDAPPAAAPLTVAPQTVHEAAFGSREPLDVPFDPDAAGKEEQDVHGTFSERGEQVEPNLEPFRIDEREPERAPIAKLFHHLRCPHVTVPHLKVDAFEVVRRNTLLQRSDVVLFDIAKEQPVKTR
jgi:hypothetical protein